MSKKHKHGKQTTTKQTAITSPKFVVLVRATWTNPDTKEEHTDQQQLTYIFTHRDYRVLEKEAQASNLTPIQELCRRTTLGWDHMLHDAHPEYEWNVQTFDADSQQAAEIPQDATFTLSLMLEGYECGEDDIPIGGEGYWWCPHCKRVERGQRES